LPEGIMALPLLQMAYRGQVQLTPQQIVALTSMTAQDFATRLERALQRSDAVLFPKLIEASTEPTD
jgi:hypothetical protein